MTYLVFTDFKLFCGLYELLEEGLSGRVMISFKYGSYILILVVSLVLCDCHGAAVINPNKALNEQRQLSLCDR
jgi:hypothetical protein